MNAQPKNLLETLSKDYVFGIVFVFLECIHLLIVLIWQLGQCLTEQWTGFLFLVRQFAWLTHDKIYGRDFPDGLFVCKPHHLISIMLSSIK